MGTAKLQLVLYTIITVQGAWGREECKGGGRSLLRKEMQNINITIDYKTISSKLKRYQILQ